MKREAIIVFVAIMFFSLFLFIALKNPVIVGNFIKEGNAYNCSSCADCTSAIADASAGDTVYLNNTLANQAGNCIDFADADNVIFDCMNYSNLIQGDGVVSDSGIFLNNGNYNNTVLNCNVSNFQYGVYFGGSSNNTIRGLDIFLNEVGVRFAANSYNNTIINSAIRKNTEQGVYREDISNDGNSLQNINITANKYGIYIEGSAVLPP